MASPVVVKTVGEPADSSPNHPADGAAACCSNLVTVWDWPDGDPADATFSHRCFSQRPCWGGDHPCKHTRASAASFTAAPTFGRTEVVFLSYYCVRQKCSLEQQLVLPLHGPWSSVGGPRRKVESPAAVFPMLTWDTEASRKKKALQQESSSKEEQPGQRWAGQQQESAQLHCTSEQRQPSQMTTFSRDQRRPGAAATLRDGKRTQRVKRGREKLNADSRRTF